MSDVTQGGEAPVVPAPPEKSLRAKAIHGTAWTLGGFGVSRFIQFGSQVVSTHLLAPELVGVMQLVTSVLQGLQMFSDLGIGPNIIQSKRGDDPHFLNTAWTVQVLRGVGIWLVAALLAWPMSVYWKTPEAIWILPVAGLTAVIGGFGATRMYTLNRNLAVARLTLFALVTQVLGVATMLACAYRWHSVWALVVGSLAGALARTALSFFISSGNRDRFELEPRAVRSLVHFGGWIFVGTLLTYLGQQGDRLILGGQIPMAIVGMYGQALTIARLPLDIVSNVDQSVAFPAYSQVINSGRPLREVFTRVRLPMCVIGTMGIVGAASCGPEAIRLLLDERYHAGAAFVPILCVATFFQMLELACGSALISQGRVKWLAYAQAVKAVGLPLGIFAGMVLGERYGLRAGDEPGSAALWSHRLYGAMIGMACADLVKHVVTAAMTRATGLPVFRQDIALAALAAIGYSAAEYVQRRGVPVLRDALGIERPWAQLLMEMACVSAVVLVIFSYPAWLSVRELRRRKA